MAWGHAYESNCRHYYNHEYSLCHVFNLLVSNRPFHHSYHIFFGDESPVSGVGGVDHVVSCHEVVVVPELVALQRGAHGFGGDGEVVRQENARQQPQPVEQGRGCCWRYYHHWCIVLPPWRGEWGLLYWVNLTCLNILYFFSFLLSHRIVF